MKRLYILFIISSFILSACSKDNAVTEEHAFGEKTLQCESGSFLVLFKADGVWAVSSDVDWIHVEDRLYQNEAAFEVRYDSNESTIGDHRFCRLGHVNIVSKTGNRKNTMSLRQQGLAPYMHLSSGTFPQEAGTYSLELESNLTDRERGSITFGCDASWISDITLGRDGKSIQMNVSAGSGRSCNISMTFTDQWKRTYTVSATVKQ
jgi:hypothetical protein